MWYRRTFTVPTSWHVTTRRCARATCPHLVLRFGAVDFQATVNGQRVGSHRGGYDAWSVDATSALERSGRQEVVVKAIDPTDTGSYNQPIGKQRNSPSGIWYTSSSGIWRTVRLEPVAASHIERLDTTPNIRDNTLAVNVRASVARGQTVRVTAFAGKRRVGAVLGAANSSLRLPVPNAKLWSPDDPYLYELRVEILQGNAGSTRSGATSRCGPSASATSTASRTCGHRRLPNGRNGNLRPRDDLIGRFHDGRGETRRPPRPTPAFDGHAGRPIERLPSMSRCAGFRVHLCLPMSVVRSSWSSCAPTVP